MSSSSSSGTCWASSMPWPSGAHVRPSGVGAPGTTGMPAPGDDIFQVTLMQAITDLEAAIQSLSHRVRHGEEQLSQLEGSLQHMAEQLVRFQGQTEARTPERALQMQLTQIEGQLLAGEQRLSSQSQVLHTMAAVMQSMSTMVSVRDLLDDGLPMQDLSAGQPRDTGFHMSDPATASYARPAAEASHRTAVPTAPRPPPWPISWCGGKGVPFQPVLEPSRESEPDWQAAHNAEAIPETFPSLQRNGQEFSEGSRGHPDSCMPCSFYCFSKRGCKKGSTCEFCHMLHVSRSTRRLRKADPRDDLSRWRRAHSGGASSSSTTRPT